MSDEPAAEPADNPLEALADAARRVEEGDAPPLAWAPGQSLIYQTVRPAVLMKQRRAQGISLAALIVGILCAAWLLAMFILSVFPSVGDVEGVMALGEIALVVATMYLASLATTHHGSRTLITSARLLAILWAPALLIAILIRGPDLGSLLCGTVMIAMLVGLLALFVLILRAVLG